ncbi:MAG: hypothetical protein IPH20_18425 [Bacteroidales bacterium]|nr:hypothetical protein [Bacteroidales bacterium]
MDNIDLARTTDAETYVILPPQLPLWLKLLNFINLAPVLAWPLVFFSSVFFFDAPESKLQAYIAFIVVNS